MANSAVVREGEHPQRVVDVRDLIFRVYGYQKVVELMRGGLPDRMPVWKFLEGTFLGTADPNLRTTLEERESSRRRDDAFPRIARVRAVEGELPWEIKNGTLFGERDGEAARKFLQSGLRLYFPRTTFGLIRPADPRRVIGWKFEASRPDAVLTVLKDLGRTNVTTVLRFNADGGVVDQINGIVSDYRQFLRTRG